MPYPAVPEGMFALIRSHPYRTAGVAAVVLAAAAWLAFGYFGVHTLVVDDVVSEAAPVFDAPAPATSEAPVAAAEPTAPTVPPSVSPPVSSSVLEPVPPVPSAPPTSAPAAPEVVVEYAGEFVDQSRYTTDGQAVVLGNGTGQRFLRFEDFATDNGPDLNVYLVNSSTGDVSDFVDLGDLTGNIGEQNYEIPAGVDLEIYDQVVIWCVRFGVGFGSATLTAA